MFRSSPGIVRRVVPGFGAAGGSHALIFLLYCSVLVVETRAVMLFSHTHLELLGFTLFPASVHYYAQHGFHYRGRNDGGVEGVGQERSTSYVMSWSCSLLASEQHHRSSE